jgi:hypothetical protein
MPPIFVVIGAQRVDGTNPGEVIFPEDSDNSSSQGQIRIPGSLFREKQATGATSVHAHYSCIILMCAAKDNKMQ